MSAVINSPLKPSPLEPWGQIFRAQWGRRGGSRSPGEVGDLSDPGWGMASEAACLASLGGGTEAGRGREGGAVRPWM